jgi:hypothetical protein
LSTRQNSRHLNTTISVERQTREKYPDEDEYPMSYALDGMIVRTYKEAAEAMIKTIRDKRKQETTTALEDLVEEMYMNALEDETNGEQVNWEREAGDMALYTRQTLNEVDL